MLKTDGVIWRVSIDLDGFSADMNDSLDVTEGDRGCNPVA